MVSRYLGTSVGKGSTYEDLQGRERATPDLYRRNLTMSTSRCKHAHGVSDRLRVIEPENKPWNMASDSNKQIRA